jgi:poly(A) polymerase/tRNA nucleotidyltransferase (CCA-adding enzyme)
MAKNKDLLAKVSKERIRDEFTKIILSKEPMRGLELLIELGLMPYVIRETLDSVGVKQNGDHIYDVWEHTKRVVQHSADRDWPLHVRLAALFHDIGKPKTRRWSDEKKDYTFYGHEVVGAKMAKKIMEDLKFPVKLTETVEKLVRNHMFFSDIDKITLSAARRIVAKVGSDNVWDLMKVRACDRIGMGRPKEAPYRLRKYESMIEEAMRAPTSVGMLKIGGEDVIRETGERPGPKIGFILHALLEEVLENPDLNTEEYLVKRSKGLIKLSEVELKKLGESGKEAKEEKEAEELSKIRQKHGVK